MAPLLPPPPLPSLPHQHQRRLSRSNEELSSGGGGGGGSHHHHHQPGPKDAMKSVFEMMANNLLLHGPAIGTEAATDDATDKGAGNKVEIELNINCRDRDGHTPLMLVCIHTAVAAGDSESGSGGGGGGHLRECVHILLRHPETNVNLKSSDGSNALHLLCSNKNLLINGVGAGGGEAEMLQVARMLVDNGIDVDDVNKKKRTALQNLEQTFKSIKGLKEEGGGGGRKAANDNKKKSSLVEFLASKSTAAAVGGGESD